MSERDPDAERDAYHEAWAADMAVREAEERHKCPPDMPPCPECQAIEEAEDEREFGLV